MEALAFRHGTTEDEARMKKTEIGSWPYLDQRPDSKRDENRYSNGYGLSRVNRVRSHCAQCHRTLNLGL
jgi:hypothetical protein